MREHNFLLTAALGVFLGSLLLTVPGSANAGDPAIDIKYRQSTMKAIGGHMGAIVATVKGQAGTDTQMIAHARALATTATTVDGIFPKGSGQGETEALPEIWKNPAEFTKVVQAFQSAAAAMGAAADKGDAGAVKAALGALGKSCGGCHKVFRKKK